MHRTIIAVGFLLTTSIAALRARAQPLFIQGSYKYLNIAPLTTEQAFALLMLLYGILMGLAHVISKRRNIPNESLALLVATPALLISGVLVGPGLPLAIITALLVMLWRYPIVQMILSLIAPVLHPAGYIIAFIVLLLNVARNNKLTALIGLAGIIGILQHTPFILTVDISLIELGILTGTSIFFPLLALAGTFTAWNKESYRYILMAYPLMLAGIIIPELRIAAALPIAYLAGHAIYTLRIREWTLESIRTISIFLIGLGIIFAVASTVSLAISAEPTQDFSETLRVLDGLNKRQPVYTSPQYVDLLQVYGINATSTFTEEIMGTRRFDVAQQYLPRYVLLHSSEPAGNLRFLIQNTDNFKVLHRSSYELWEVKPS